MIETYEFRVQEQYASIWLKPEDGKRLSDSVRQLVLDSQDPRIKIVQLATRQLIAEGKYFYFGWNIKRTYTQQELDTATRFQLLVTANLSSEAEMYGTKYDESLACPHCGAGAPRIGPLFFPASKMPKNKDICRTIANEIIVSRRFAELFKRHAFTGASFGPIYSSRSATLESGEWFELIVNNCNVVLNPLTQAGSKPFVDKKESPPCPVGHCPGINLLTEVYVEAVTDLETDLMCSREFIGIRMGVLRPQHVFVISPKLRQQLELEKIKGYKLEVVHEV